MTTLEQSMYSQLTGYSALSALVGTRVHPLVLDPDGDLPQVLYQRISAVREQAFGQSTKGTTARFQFTVWADGASAYTSARAVMTEVRNALVGWTWNSNKVEVYFDADIDDYDAETRLFRVIQDVFVTVSGDA